MIEEKFNHPITTYYDEEYHNNYYDIYYNEMILSENIIFNYKLEEKYNNIDIKK